MPPKRKALAETDGNRAAVARPAKKATKTSSATKKLRNRKRANMHTQIQTQYGLTPLNPSALYLP